MPENGSQSVTEHVWLCPVDKTAVLSTNDEETCPVCQGTMQTIGWIEKVLA